MQELKQVEIAPGFFTLGTDRGGKNRWKTGDHVRFFRGAAEKLGGNTKTITASFLGRARSAIDWQSLTFLHYLALGTHLKLYVQNGGVFYDITPYRITGTLVNNPFTMTNTSTLVSVAHVGHGLAVGDYTYYSGATAAGGITINGAYSVTSVTSADVYVVTHSAAATSSVAGGGAAVAYQYEIGIGTADTEQGGLGYGIGAWGSSTWGTARTSTNLVNLCRIWSLDNWGEDLIASPRGGSIYVWDASTGTGTRAAIIAAAPITAKSVLVSRENRHLIALGAHDGSVNDPLLIRWCSQEDYTVWTPTETNTAGRKRLDGGAEIFCGVKVGNEILVHTDSTFTAMIFEGPPYTFGFYPKGSNGGLRGPNAAKSHNGRAFWIGEGDFYVYDGRMRVLPCDVHNYIFDDISVSQQAKIFAGANSGFGEIWWLYPAAASTECDRYVIYNELENHWVFGTLARTVIVADSKLFGPYAAGQDGFVYDQESSVDDNGMALASSLSTWDIELGDGQQIMHMGKIVPDFKRLVGSMNMSLAAKKYPQSAAVTQSVGSMTSSTPFKNPHMRGRQISLTLSTSAAGDDWRMGTLRIEVGPDGGQ